MTQNRNLSIHADYVSTAGVLNPAGGGTGIATTPANGQIPIGNGTNYTAATITAGTGITVTNGAGSISIATSGSVASVNGFTGTVQSVVVQGTAVASTSGTSIDFTSIPSWVKRVTVMFNGVSTNGTSFYQIQVGTGGSPTTSGYSAQTTGIASSSGASSSSTSGFPIYTNAAAYAWSGAITLFNVSGNIWVASGLLGNPNTNALLSTSSGTVTLSGVLNIVRITTAGGTDTFDAGSINIQYE